jgi:hypothetical protein
MVFGRSGTCDQRRRRVLIEENISAGEENGGEPSAGDRESVSPGVRTPPRRYPEAASAACQPLTAVIPQRGWTLLVLLLGGLAAVVGLEALHGQSQIWPAAYWPRRVPAFNVLMPGGLATWFASLVLAFAGFQGVQVYRLRRHRADDYRGRYRHWLWASSLLFVLAASVGTHVHIQLAEPLLQELGLSAAWRSILPTVLLPAVLWVPFAVCLALEMRESRLAEAALLGASLAYAASCGLSQFTGLLRDPITGTMVVSALGLLGHVAVWLMTASYARHVFLDSQGLVVRTERAPRVQRKAKKERKKAREAKPAPPAVRTSEVTEPSGSAEKNAPTAAAGKAVSKAADKAVSKAADKAVSKAADKAVGDEKAPAVSPEEPEESSAENEEDEDAGATLSFESADLNRSERRRLKKMARRGQVRKAA